MPRGSIVVTGAAGFAGAHLVALLARESGDRRIEGWARSSRQPAALAPEVGWRGADLLDADAVSRAVAEAQPSEIYHLAGASHTGASWKQPAAYLEIHVRGTHHLLEAVRRHAPKCRVLIISSGMIYRPQDRPVNEDAPLGPVSPYALSKLAEDQLALYAATHDDLDIVVARPFNHIGPGQAPTFAASSFARQIAEIEHGTMAPCIAVGNLDAARDISDVRDVVAAYAALMARGATATAYNVCRGETVTMSTLLEQLIAQSTVSVTLTQDAARLRPNDVPFLAGDPSRIRAATGWRATTPLGTTLSDLLDYWRRALADAR